jgi:hypothetical protein
MPKKRPAEGTPRRMARGGEVKFPFRLDCERAYAAWGAQARPPAVAAKYDDPDDQANQQPYGSHEKAGAPKLPAKGKQGLIFASSNKDDSDGNDIVCGGATKPAVRQASAATKDGHGVRTICADKDDPDNDGSKPWRLRPSLTAGLAGPLARPRAGTATRSQAAVRTARTATTVCPWVPKKPTLLQILVAPTVWSKVGARRGDGGAGIYPDNGVAAAARSAPGAKGCMPNDGSKAALEGITGAKVVRGALAALRDNINKEGEQDDGNEEEQSSDVKGKMAPTIAPKFGLTLRTGVGSTAGARAYGSPAAEGGPAAAKRQNMTGGKIPGVSSNLDRARRHTNPPRLATAKAATGAKGPEVIPLDKDDKFSDEGTLTMTLRPARSGKPRPGKPPIFF